MGKRAGVGFRGPAGRRSRASQVFSARLAALQVEAIPTCPRLLDADSLEDGAGGLRELAGPFEEPLKERIFGQAMNRHGNLDHQFH